MATLNDAIKLAKSLHQGQKDLAGKPYIEHPLRVMNAVYTETEKIVAVLHDVLEDCPITASELINLGYSDEVVEALEVLKKGWGEDYDSYINRVAAGPKLAIRVKIADLEDNMNLSRISNPKEEDRERTRTYERAHRFLQDYL